MSGEPREQDGPSVDTSDLKKPSTEKDPGEEPQAPSGAEPEPSHEAVGIGVIGRPQTGVDDASGSDESSTESTAQRSTT